MTPERLLNRETSWLDFNARVLALAENPEIPLLERARFLAIWATNLDDFFQIRVAGLKEQLAMGVRTPSADGLTPTQQLEAIRALVDEQYRRVSKLFLDDLAPAFAVAGISFSNWETLDNDDRAYLVDQFKERVFPVVTPLAVDPSHPFPYISNLSLNLAVFVRHPESRVTRFARVKVPPILPRFVVMPDGERFVPLEQVIAAHLGELFPGMEILAHFPFRVTRNADMEIEEEEAQDLLEVLESELTRRRFGRVVRVEVDQYMSTEALDLLGKEMGIGSEDVYQVDGPLDVAGLWSLVELDRPDLKWEPWNWTTQPRLFAPAGETKDLFEVIRQGDVLVQHPYDSFSTSVEAFIAQAARDPAVLAIKQTLYRTSSGSPIMQHLITAAHEGKQVVALVELQARFDEERNIEWARALEEAGVHVVYGVVGLKTHTKIALVVRDEGAAIRRYVHIGTGNYNESTARIYEDLGLLSADPGLGADLSELFNFLTGYSEPRDFRRLLLSPRSLRRRMLAMIREESERPHGRIVMKMNSLVDPEMIDALYAASQAGTRIDLIVRGICCLRPGVPGMSENIAVRSIVGRYLEHSRVYRFGSDEGPRLYYIGSADLMPRNLDRRVEAVVPVDDPALQARLDDIISVQMADDELAWELGADGRWKKVPTERGVDTHLTLRALAVARTRTGI
ncbi:MAG TPA: polyphosphate kinase 1 [Acidimicrobiia bacterium]|nr:polyphosphate kinase 1 [Acidimicrobiia bacterium]